MGFYLSSVRGLAWFIVIHIIEKGCEIELHPFVVPWTSYLCRIELELTDLIEKDKNPLVIPLNDAIIDCLR
jgi:hypothetical protein